MTLPAFQCGRFQQNAFQMNCPEAGDTRKQDRKRVAMIKRAIRDDRDMMEIGQLFMQMKDK